MRVPFNVLFCSTIVLAAAMSTNFGWAQSKKEVSVNDHTCKQVMRESGPQRDAAIAFIHGYLLGKSGVVKFDVRELLKQTDAFIDYCLDNPKAKALDAMMKSKS
jgi:hypothetical protein